MPFSSTTTVLLSVLYSALVSCAGLAVFVAAFVKWPHTRRYLRAGAGLALLAFALGLPAVVTTAKHLDLSRSMTQLGPDVVRVMGVLMPVIVVLSALWSLIYGCLELPVAVLVQPERAAFPLLLGGQRRTGGWVVAALLGLLLGVMSTVGFHLLGVSAGPIWTEIQKATPQLDMNSAAYRWGVLVPALLAAAIVEERFFRGIVQPWLMRVLGGGRVALAIALCVTAGVWALGHAGNSDHIALKLAQIFVLGIVLGLLARRYSVEASIVGHGALNVAAVLAASAIPWALVTFWGADPQTLQWRHQGEQQWLVAETADSMVAMARYAHGRTALGIEDSVHVIEGPGTAGASGSRFHVSGSGLSAAVDLELAPHAFAPEAYVGLAQTLLPVAASPATHARADDEALLTALLDLRGSVIQAQNAIISTKLSQQMLDPGLHEQAALLLGALALREAAGTFSDVRPLLCRLTAHLALARALRGSEPVGLAGRYAEVALSTLLYRQREALERLDALARPELLTVEKAWINALRIRNTSDWRLLPANEGSLLERLQYYRALIDFVSTSRGAAYLDEYPTLEDIPDWGSLTLEQSFSVGDGHRFVSAAVKAQLAEARQVWEASTGETFPAAGWREVLAGEPAPGGIARVRGVTAVQVIDWGLWAGFFERHVCHQVVRSIYWYRDLWGSKEAGERYETWADASFSDLPQYSIVRKRRAREAGEYRQAMPAASRLCAQAPHLVTAANWACLREAPDFAPLADGTIPDGSWFSRGILPGTAYDAGARLWHLERLRRPPLALLETIRSLAPYDADNAWRYMNVKYERRQTREQIEQEDALFASYNLGALMGIAKTVENDPVQYRTLYGRVCALDPDKWRRLGSYLVEHGDEQGAVDAYEHMVAEAYDRVGVANDADWLVNYYYDHGRKPAAFALAEEAAEAYSSLGLQTMAVLLEKDGRYEEAIGYYKKRDERYDDLTLPGFYLRYDKQFRTNKYEKEVKAALASLFPGGPQPARLEDFKAPPSEGVSINSESNSLKQAGLGRGDVIVALDGYRVANYEQYKCVREWTLDPRMGLIVWRHGAYVEVRASAKRRLFNVDMATYRR